MQPDVEMGLLYHGFEMPARESLGDLDESQWELGLDGAAGRSVAASHVLAVLQDVETLELFTFDTSLEDRPPRCRRSAPALRPPAQDQPATVPLVWLRTGGFEHKDPRVGFVRDADVRRLRAPAGRLASPSRTRRTGGILDDDIPDFDEE